MCSTIYMTMYSPSLAIECKGEPNWAIDLQVITNHRTDWRLCRHLSRLNTLALDT
jgi:hypothetical protein